MRLRRQSFWQYLVGLLDDSTFRFHDVNGVRIFPVYAKDGQLTGESCVLVIHSDGRDQQVNFSVNESTHAEAERIMEEIAKAALS